MKKDTILNDYSSNRASLLAAGDQISAQIIASLEERLIKTQSVSYRLKEEKSLANKIGRPDRIYEKIQDVTDTLGFRVITYFEDGITEVARLLEDEFEVDLQKSIDKRSILDSNEFGYRSLHYICYLPDEIKKDFPISDFQFEVQICSILQHAWAEIEHDLGYKSNLEVPTEIRRRFFRLAGLLELADEEFLNIRDSLDQYQNRVASRIDVEDNLSINIDALSLKSFIESNRVSEIDLGLAKQLGLAMSEDLFFPDYLIKMLNHVGIVSIEQLKKEIAKYREIFGAFVTKYFEFTDQCWNFRENYLGTFPKGYSVFLLVYMVILDSSPLELQKIENLSNFFEAMDYQEEPSKARQVANQFWEIVREYWDHL